MEVAEFALIFSILVIYLVISISMLVQPRKILFTPYPLLYRLSMIAFKPGSEVQLELYIPEGVVIVLKNDTIELRGAEFNPALMRNLKLVNLLRAWKDGILYLNIHFAYDVTLSGGYVYYLRLRALRIDVVEVEVLRQYVP